MASQPSEQVTHLDEYQAAQFGEWAVCAHVWAPDPGAAWIGSELVLKRALKDEDLFAPQVVMLVECGARRPTYQRSVCGVELVQWNDVKPDHQAWQPLPIHWADDDPFPISTV